MPALVEGITAEEIQEELIFLDNDLVNDLTYYKSAVDDRDYTMSVYKVVKLPIRELKASDCHSLDGNNWVTNFVLDIVLNLFDETSAFQIIPKETASYIFNESSGNVTEYFLRKVRIIKDRIAMAVRINGNHHCVVYIDYESKRFSFIDLFTTSGAEATVYLKKYREFMRTYDKYFENDTRDADNLIYIYGHYKQKDSHNCGPIILDLFHKIIHNENMYQEPGFHP
ncbi:unnamed protein product [Phaedon cochleariae]|uniref:Uncharacterized protein n=1 Tax=Phaedon cochleariae TaxID=80249 RepID=A0A9N9SHK7_PHACE|nr:unnamed protein product [Phaedon cochleariae]